jgi:DNA-binding transcriptional ArsR family regulator
MPSRSTSSNRFRLDPSQAAPLFAALGDETRLRLVTRLGSGEPLSISHLAEDSGLTRQAITKHLQVLEGVGLATSTRHGRECRWRLNAAQVREARRCLEVITSQWEEALGRLKASLEAR